MNEELEIRESEISGPLDLAQTIRSGQTAGPEWEAADGKFTDVDEVNDSIVKFIIWQEGTVDKPSLKVRLTPHKPGRGLASTFEEHISQILRLHDSVEEFYQLAHRSSDSVLLDAISKFSGLRLMLASNLFESLVCSIASQNASVSLWNRAVKLMRLRFGRKVYFPDGMSGYIFPKPEEVAFLRTQELKSVTGLGYRAKYIIHAAKAIIEGALNLEDLKKLSYDKAKEALMELEGVGPKVADCFLLYGLGKTEAAPVDIWVHRIASESYFRGRKVAKDAVGSIIRERYGPWAGYAQLYLFLYGRLRSAGSHGKYVP